MWPVGAEEDTFMPVFTTMLLVYNQEANGQNNTENIENKNSKSRAKGVLGQCVTHVKASDNF